MTGGVSPRAHEADRENELLREQLETLRGLHDEALDTWDYPIRDYNEIRSWFLRHRAALAVPAAREPEPLTKWTCLTCGCIGDAQSCYACGGEAMPGEWVPAARVEAPEPEPREGMAMVYDWHGRYIGCIGIETWREQLAEAARDVAAARVEGSRTEPGCVVCGDTNAVRDESGVCVICQPCPECGEVGGDCYETENNTVCKRAPAAGAAAPEDSRTEPKGDDGA